MQFVTTGNIIIQQFYIRFLIFSYVLCNNKVCKIDFLFYIQKDSSIEYFVLIIVLQHFLSPKYRNRKNNNFLIFTTIIF